MSKSLPQPPDLDPTALSNPTLGRARRGFEPAEVNQLLGRGADALRAWQDYGRELTIRIEELEAELVEAHKLDEGRIASVLGEETARIISAAREAAAEIKAKASEEAGRLVAESEETSRATANALTTEAEALRAEAETMRDEAAREYSAKVDQAQARHDQLLTDGQARHDELLAEATTLRDELVSVAQTRHDELLSEGKSRHDELLAEAHTRHDEMLTAAEQILAERTAEATAAADEIVADARSQGRAMVAEAKAVRDRILTDLAERRRIARRQIEGAVAGRDSIVDVLRAAGESVASIITGLKDADSVAQNQANHVAGALHDDSVEFLASLDVNLPVIAEDDTEGGDTEGRSEDLAATAVPDAEPDDEETSDPPHTHATGVGDPDTGAVVAATPVVTDDSGVSSDADDEQSTVAVAEHEDVVAVVQEFESVEVAGAGVTEIGAQHVDSATAGDRSAGKTEEGASGEDPGSSDGATVHDLFARIRAQELDNGEPDDGYDDQPADVHNGEEPDEIGGRAEDDGAQGRAGSGDNDDGVVIDLSSADADGAHGSDELARVVELLDARDELLVPVERQMLRALRRLASDEQNEVLDRLRRIKRGRPDMDDVIPTADEMLMTFSDGILADFSAAVRAGFDFWVDVGGATEMATFVVPADVRSRLEGIVSGFISLHRAHLEKAMDQSTEAGTGTEELMAAIKAVYRDWRQASLSEMAGDLAIAGFSHGERTAAGPGVPWMWVVDNGGLPCADGEDNALAGPVLSDEAFPTGDLFPPAHSGCRCILVPADN